jgi:protein-disulfide isomerase
MLYFTRFAGTVSVILLLLTTACSQSEQSQDTSSGSKSSELTAASNQTSSSAVAAKVALASHLKQVGAKFYGTYWCPYCSKQKEMFGKEAFSQLNYIECDPKGTNPRPDLCQKANINGFPTWEINGQQYGGVQSLEQLADLSRYKGDRHFGN